MKNHWHARPVYELIALLVVGKSGNARYEIIRCSFQPGPGLECKSSTMDHSLCTMEFVRGRRFRFAGARVRYDLLRPGNGPRIRLQFREGRNRDAISLPRSLR